MIGVIDSGRYRIVETKRSTKILYLGDVPYVWIRPATIGEILVSSHRKSETDTNVSTGKYMLYDVEDEDFLTDLEHLELEYGNDAWQGYLLPTGLPTDKKIRARIIPTDQLITNTSYAYALKHMIFNHPKLLVRTGEPVFGRAHKLERSAAPMAQRK